MRTSRNRERDLADLACGRPVPPRGPVLERIAPLPPRFRLSDTGRPISEAGRRGGATGAGGGRGTGVVHRRAEGPVPDGAVLVMTTLDPAIAPDLPRLAGLVAETGSVLSHLAILAREAGVPVVVGAVDATIDLSPGERVTVDGDTGEVFRESDR